MLIYGCFCFTDYAKAFDCVDHNKLWKILKEMGVTDHLTCLLRNPQVKKQQNQTWNNGLVQNREGVHQDCILSPCLFNLYAEYIMRNVGRNINNLRYTVDTTLIVESEEELKSLLMEVKEESEKIGLKPNIENLKVMACSPNTL